MLKHNRLILIVALALTCLYNFAFFKHLNQVYPAFAHLGFFSSVASILFCLLTLIFTLLCWGRLTKWVLMLFVLIAAFAAYYMDTFDIVIDKGMIQNIMETNVREARDLFTSKLVIYAVILGFVPAFLIYKAQLPAFNWRSRLMLMGSLLLIIVAQAAVFSKNYASFFREQKTIRFYANPVTPIYSVFNFFSSKDAAPQVVAQLGTDAHIPATDVHRELIIIVVGETARADHFSLNGYPRPTNPLLAKENVVSFKNVTSCGTSTAVSVPCMFSALGREAYSNKKFKASENLLDVLTHAKVNVLWRDNNSDSKGVAERVTYQDYQSPKNNSICDVECRDEGMLVGLQDYIDQHPTGDITIVLHQMGNHGPAYYKRYPAAFEQFKPACQNNLLEKCTTEEVTNAYDNAILYTDYFLSKTIGLLKKNTQKFEAALFYISDHGESLGENGLYLHGMPYAIAPAAQKHVGAMMWVSDNFDIPYTQLKTKENKAYSHDNLFHTVLGFMEIESKVYDASKDILR